jgi:SAM-dependent methyltransferase
VVVIETVAEQACFIGIRARQTNLPVETICTDFLRLPLAPGRFDAVFLNGIPKHSGVQAESGPWKAQVRLLRALRDTLKPSGFLCLSAENRLGRRQLFSRRRRNAEGGRPAFLHSLSGYRRLFREAGFGAVRVFHAWNGRRYPAMLLPLHNRNALRYFAGLEDGLARRGLAGRARHWALWVAACTGLWQRCASEVIFMAKRS